MPEPDVISVNSTIAGYAQNGHVNEALKLFEQM
jgi:pentatricopeptide repeat protein